MLGRDRGLVNYEKYEYVNFNHHLINKYVDVNAKADLFIKTDRQLEYILDVQARNNKTLSYIQLPYYMSSEDLSNEKHNDLVNILNKVLVF